MRVGLARAAVVAVLAAFSVTGVAVSANADTITPPDSSASIAQWERQLAARSAAARIPSSSLGSASVGASSSFRIAGATRAITQTVATNEVVATAEVATAVGTASKFGTVVKGAGVVGVAWTGFDLSYSATGWVGQHFFGVQSDGFICDVSSIVTETRACSLTLNQEPNGDVLDDPMGWVGGPTVATRRGAWTSLPGDGAGQNVTGAVVATASFGQVGSVTLSIVGSQSVVPSGKYDALSWVIFQVNDNGAETARTSSVVHWYPGSVNTFQTTVSGSKTAKVQLLDAATNAVLATWYPVGHSSRPATPDQNPDRWWRTQSLCESGYSGTRDSPHFKETDASFPSPPDPQCDGSAVSGVTVSYEGTGMASQLLYEWHMPPELKQWAAQYPECTNATCLLELSRVDSQTGARLACFDNPSLCADWVSDPDRVTNYQCTYGTHDVPLEECYVYGPTFKAPGGDGAVQYGDPATGEGLPGSSPGTGESGGDGCPPAFSWAGLFNPWWYYKGVSCALREAFVPSGDLVAAQVSATEATLGSTPPFSAFTVVKPVVTGLGKGWSQGCSGSVADFDPQGRGRLSIPCKPPASDSFSALYALAVMAVVISTALAAWHMFVAALGGRGAEGAE